jgi:hypothetical protein
MTDPLKPICPCPTNVCNSRQRFSGTYYCRFDALFAAGVKKTPEPKLTPSLLLTVFAGFTVGALLALAIKRLFEMVLFQ